MGLFEHFPYTNFHELNLDWITKFVKSVRDRLDLIDAAVKAAQDARDASEGYSLDSQNYSLDSQNYSLDAEAWARGTRNGEPVDADAPQYHNNAEYYSGVASGEAELAIDAATAAQAYEREAEAWAVGTKNGNPVPASAPQYENNSKYWADQSAAAGATAGAAAATAAVAAVKQEMFYNFFEVMSNGGYVNKVPYNHNDWTVPGLFEFTVSGFSYDYSGRITYDDWSYNPDDIVVVGGNSWEISSADHNNLVVVPYNVSLGNYNGNKIFAVRIWNTSTGTWAADNTVIPAGTIHFYFQAKARNSTLSTSAVS